VNSHKTYKLKATQSAEKFQKVIREMFDDADSRKDGVLDQGEFQQFSLDLMEALEALHF
jgi:hypothetical protein